MHRRLRPWFTTKTDRFPWPALMLSIVRRPGASASLHAYGLQDALPLQYAMVAVEAVSLMILGANSVSVGSVMEHPARTPVRARTLRTRKTCFTPPESSRRCRDSGLGQWSGMTLSDEPARIWRLELFHEPAFVGVADGLGAVSCAGLGE
jgi:hypothetical protein